MFSLFVCFFFFVGELFLVVVRRFVFKRSRIEKFIVRIVFILE